MTLHVLALSSFLDVRCFGRTLHANVDVVDGAGYGPYSYVGEEAFRGELESLRLYHVLVRLSFLLVQSLDGSCLR